MTRRNTFLAVRDTFISLSNEYRTKVQKGIALTNKESVTLATAFANARLALVRLYEIMKDIDTENETQYDSLANQTRALSMPGVDMISNTGSDGGAGDFGGGGAGSR